LLIEPWTITNKSGKPFQVFTPFWKTCLDKIAIAQVLLSPPAALTPPERWPQSLSLDEFELEPALPWAEGFGTIWKPGTTGAMEKIKSFLKEGFSNYSEARDRPDRSGTSRLSPHLHFGEISPRHVWVAIRKHAFKHHIDEQTWRSSQFITELGWREFSHHLLYHFPTTPNEPLRKVFNFFPWRKSSLFLKAWQKGRTGYPIVDAGMRQLWHTGWMHNRVRMIVASFLVKDLLINWQEGANWFWDTLVDADLAQNTLGWQWVTGCGADAAPYFRVFNPTIQGTKFDPNGDYIRKWVPELNQVPTEWIHQPFKAPLDILARAGVELDVQYPTPILSHVIAREVALEAYSRLKQREKARG
ncbi:MAG: phrB, partial [Verrucomicrobiales bacterium]|nr:phrB [Verrucomicrobiales bacterium]